MKNRGSNFGKFFLYIGIAVIISIITINVMRLYLIERECPINIQLVPVEIDKELQICQSSNSFSFIIENKNNFQIDKIRIRAIDDTNKVLIRDIENSAIQPGSTLQSTESISGYSKIKRLEFIPFIITEDKIRMCSNSALVIDNPKNCTFKTLLKK